MAIEIVTSKDEHIVELKKLIKGDVFSRQYPMNEENVYILTDGADDQKAIPHLLCVNLSNGIVEYFNCNDWVKPLRAKLLIKS